MLSAGPLSVMFDVTVAKLLGSPLVALANAGLRSGWALPEEAVKLEEAKHGGTYRSNLFILSHRPFPLVGTAPLASVQDLVDKLGKLEAEMEEEDGGHGRKRKGEARAYSAGSGKTVSCTSVYGDAESVRAPYASIRSVRTAPKEPLCYFQTPRKSKEVFFQTTVQ